MRVYLDHCAYNRPFDDQSNIKNQLETTAKLYIQAQIRQGKYDLVWSYMSDLENSNNPNLENKNSIQVWENIAKYKCKSSENILVKGKQIEQNKIRPNDALHIACAIESQCEYFITTDEGLKNKGINEIIIINPIDFIRMEGNENEN
jgi:predicted nucleic acid-binding protein